ncbi:MAG: hypothetical protein A3K19_12875 [Lentisphaerae bacterium RIFOXYB12_FULL_65_16]|nr:MAG: hypothetical protein A3K18_04830 [Lentisphaerae bacterium RIFOXYA12_64_32]OGV87205.1 MAG: hypothetical protein A3K19_12875 [Lentisphaerae bacterium RIFOXYB12_FULL_65_16]
MDEHALNVLGYPALLQAVAGYAQTSGGRDLLLRLRPAVDLAQVTAHHGLYAECLALLETGSAAPDLGFPDLAEILARVAPEGAVIEGPDLLQCQELLRRSTAVQGFLQREECRGCRHLLELGRALDPCVELQQRLQRALDKDGELVDRASERLRELRTEIRSIERRIQTALDTLLKAPGLDPVLQERFVTVRNGRYVIPVRREEKAGLPGVTHDHSNSGQTLFIEPTQTLPLGNDLADVRLHERDECRRILADLSAQVRGRRAAVEANQQVLTEMDAALAVAAWACDYHCTLPVFGAEFGLVRARHPLLEKQFRTAGGTRQVVPIDVRLKPQTRVFLLTGSNTGGKTAALKTIGLLALAAQAGLPLPVDAASRFVVFRQVFADIGDEQSLLTNLSTFSAHISHVANVLRQLGSAPALVLLDELGAGTDPLEGGALACAILDELCRRAALTVATTHLGTVKTFVHEQAGMLNASVRFNVETLQPEYVLDIGRPGASNALNIARRLGLPNHILHRAERHLSSDHLRLEGILGQMEEDQRRLSVREDELQATVTDLARDRTELRKELQALKKERRRLLHDAYLQASGIVENTRRQMENMLRELHAAHPQAPRDGVTADVRRVIRAQTSKLDVAVEETAPRPEEPVRLDGVAPGQTVWVERLQADAEVVGVDRERAIVTVLLGGVRFDVQARELGRPQNGPLPESDGALKVMVTRPRAVDAVPAELNLIGLRVDEALPRLETYLDRAVLAGLPEVRIVHGFGTGRLRAAVHESLRGCGLVRRFRLGRQGEDPGGAGATLVALAGAE